MLSHVLLSFAFCCRCKAFLQRQRLPAARCSLLARAYSSALATSVQHPPAKPLPILQAANPATHLLSSPAWTRSSFPFSFCTLAIELAVGCSVILIMTL